VKNKKELEGSLAESNIGELKARHINKVHTLTKCIHAFCVMARKPKPSLHITVESISVKVKELAARLVHEYKIDKNICTANEVAK